MTTASSIESEISSGISYAQSTFESLSSELFSLIKKVAEVCLSTFFYMGYRTAPSEVATIRVDALKQKGAYSVPCANEHGKSLDVLYLPSSSPNRTGNVIVFTINTSFQMFHPKRFEHYLRDGADVILWNPSALNPKQYKNDLVSVLKTISPEKKVTVFGYCAGVDPVVAAVSEMKRENISVVIDRGHGDIQKFARSFTFFAGLPLVQDILKEKFDAEGIEKIKQIAGNVLHIAPEPDEDQLMQYGNGRNFSYDLYEAHKATKPTHAFFLQLQNSGHWTQHNADVINRIKQFLADNGIIGKDFSPVTGEDFPAAPAPTLFQRKVIPFLAKAWC